MKISAKETFLIIALFLTGCSSQYAGLHNVSPTYQLDAQSKFGIAAVYLSFNGLHTVNYFYVTLEGAKGDFSENLTGFGMRTPGFMETTYADLLVKKGQLVIIALPEGEYEFTSFTISAVDATYYADKNFSMKFTVNASEVVYLGHMNIFVNPLSISRSNFLSGESRHKYKISVDDISERDVPELLEKLPNLKREQIVVRLLK
jgi:hypothetical protein